MTTETLTLRLEKHAYGGHALGRLPDGRAAFVPFALPNETVRVQITKEHRGHVQARLVEILEASPERETPRCVHFGHCGGCHYQHLPYAAQLQAKTGILRDQLERIGRLKDPPVQEMVASPSPWNYRNNLQFHLTSQGELAFVQAEARDLLAVHECHLPEPDLNALWPNLQFEPGLHLERVALRMGAQGEAMLVLESPEPPEMELEVGLSVVHLLGDEAVVMAGDDHLVMEVNQRLFHVSAASFFQVNAAIAGRMVTHLVERLALTQQTTLLDVYCGVGLFSAFLAERVGHLVGIETSAAACHDFGINLDEFDHVDLYQAPAEEVLTNIKVQPEVVIVDPPRAGLDKRALQALVTMRPATIAYVSCDPSTLARDAGLFVAAGYTLNEITPFDNFAQTYHLESISIFKRNEVP